jgi:hypothetical protein
MANKRYHIVIASIVFAIGLWFAINLGYEYDVEKSIPVVLDNTKVGLALKHPVPKFMLVRFRATGWQLAGVYFSPDVKYYIDMAALGPKDYIVSAKDLPEHVTLPPTVQVVTVRPDTLILAVDQFKEKRVPVAPQVALICAEGFGQIGTMHFTPDTVSISGASNVIQGISEWSTEYRRFDNLRAPVDEDISMYDPANFSIDVYPRTVHFHMDVEAFAEKTLSGIPVSAVAVPPNREVIFIPPRVELIVRGGIDQLAKISPADIQATSDYNVLVADTSGLTTPSYFTTADVKIIRRSPEKIQYVIRKKL